MPGPRRFGHPQTRSDSMQNMSFSMTTQQVEDEEKDITRRQGWGKVRPGQLLQAVEKGMGLKKGEKVRRLKVIQVVSVEERPIHDIDEEDCRREGFPHLTPAEFVEMYCKHNKVQPHDICRRIEFRYVKP
jgi:hypothetical protein